MNKAFVMISIFISISAEAKSFGNSRLKSNPGILRNVTCHFSDGVSPGRNSKGYYLLGRTPTGPTVGSVNFTEPVGSCADVTNPPPENGLIGNLILRTPGMGNKVSGVMDYYNKGLKLGKNIYFADVNVPTRPGVQGYPVSSSDVLVDDKGQKLTEKFALELTSILRLGNEEEGDYELAILSDDGARVFVEENDIWIEVINNDGYQVTRFGCPYRTLNIKRDSEIPLKILYSQNTKDLTNVLMWRHSKKPYQGSQPPRHSLCGMTGSNYFYNYKKGGKTAAMKALEKTGWKTVSASNLKMPALKIVCEPDPQPVPDLNLSAFQVDSISGANASLSWTTNLPASSQLRIVNASTGEEIYTIVNPNLVKSHIATLSGLVPGGNYLVQAISVDELHREIRSGFITLSP